MHKGILRELPVLCATYVVIFRLLSGQTYWSKDIIFLVSDHEQIGLQAWLDGYHDINSECTYMYLKIEMPSDPEILKDIFVSTTIGFLCSYSDRSKLLQLTHLRIEEIRANCKFGVNLP